jgi:hypothetical protein
MTWILFFVMLTPEGEFYNERVDEFNTMDECYYAMAEVAASFPDIEPLNWDFVCLQNPGMAA